MTTERDELANTLRFAEILADPNLSLSVPSKAKRVIRYLVNEIEHLQARVIETTPAPFPPVLGTAITEALNKHQPSRGIDGGISCWTCGELTAQMPGGYGHSAVHQWAVISEVIAQHTTTEWGVDYRDGSVDFFDSRDAADDYMPTMIGGEASREDLPLLVSRQVLPWQEVKA